MSRQTFNACVMLLFCGCSEIEYYPLEDSRIGRPDQVITRTDFDQDGLCDDTEAGIGTQSDNIDSDGDGYSDWIEYRLGSNPLRSFSPDRASLIFLDADMDSEIEVSVSENVSGNGTDYEGQFFPISILDGETATDASDYLILDEAVSATPPNNIVGTDARTFLAVRGATELNARLVFRSQTPPQSCWEPLPFTYVFRRIDGVTRNARRIMIRRPVGQEIDPSRWCRTSSGCL